MQAQCPGAYAQAIEQDLFDPAGDRNDFYGYEAVDMVDTTLVVAARNADAGNGEQGVVYIYNLRGTNWVETQRLTVPDEGVVENFGRSIALDEDGDRLIVGCRPFAGAQGVPAYVYDFDGTDWVPAAPLVETGEFYGWDVDVYGDWAVVTNQSEVINGLDFAGEAYLFRFDGQAWNLEQRLQAPTPEDGGHFGRSCTLWDGRLAIGSFGVELNGENDAGAVFIYTLQPGGQGRWRQP